MCLWNCNKDVSETIKNPWYVSAILSYTTGMLYLLCFLLEMRSYCQHFIINTIKNLTHWGNEEWQCTSCCILYCLVYMDGMTFTLRKGYNLNFKTDSCAQYHVRTETSGVKWAGLPVIACLKLASALMWGAGICAPSFWRPWWIFLPRWLSRAVAARSFPET